MPRRPNIDRPVRLELKMRESIRSRLDLWLWSEAEQRVPKGKYQEFFEGRVNAFFNNVSLDLTPFGMEGVTVEGSKDSIAALQARLRNG